MKGLGPRWILLLHQLPPKPDYARVKIWRQLQRVGAVAIKNSVYVLPRSDQSAEHFQWILREIRAAGGEGSVCEAVFVDGLSDAQIEGLFRAAREADYAAIAGEIEEVARNAPARRSLPDATRLDVEAAIGRIRRRLADVGAIDHFGAPAREVAHAALERLEGRIRRRPAPARAAARSVAKKGGRVWVTRRGVFVDRIASAWLIKRFIDPRARFRFVEERDYAPRAGEIRFDMFEAEYTHEGDRCTFETLIARFGLDDRALDAVAEMVHDIDLRDERFGRPETAGFERLLSGLVRKHSSDEDRLTEGWTIVEGFYRAFQ